MTHVTAALVIPYDSSIKQKELNPGSGVSECTEMPFLLVDSFSGNFHKKHEKNIIAALCTYTLALSFAQSLLFFFRKLSFTRLGIFLA